MLKSFSSCLKKNLRKNDLAGRIGGEKFAIALPNTILEDAIKLLNNIRLLLKNNSVELDGKTIYYTVSIGVTLFNKDYPANLDILSKQADHALYKAKKSGKNCVIPYLRNI